MDKHYLSRVLLYLLLALFGVALICEIGYQFYDSVYESVETVDMKSASVRRSVDSVGFLVQDEEPVYADAGGVCRYLADNGEKVSAGQTVVKCYDDGAALSDGRIESLERDISILTRAQTLAPAYSPASVEDEIASLRAQLVRQSREGSHETVAETEEDLRVMLAISQIATGKVDSYATRIAELGEELKTLESGLGAARNVKIDRSGYFFRNADGYEAHVDLSTLSDLTAADCLSIFKMTPEAPPEGRQAVGRLVSDFGWKMVCELDAQSASCLSENGSYTVCFGRKGTEVRMQLSALLVDEDDDRVAAVFSCDVLPTSFDFTRIQSVSIVYEEFSGYEIPSGALRVIDGVSGVYVLHGSVVQFREIRSVYWGDGYVISESDFESDSDIKPVGRYDRLIVKGKDLYVGKIVS